MAGGKERKRKRVGGKAGDEQSKTALPSTTPPTSLYRQKVLFIASRGIPARMRHLVGDLFSLCPHAKKDSKLDSKANLGLLNELAELHNCNNVLYFESKQHGVRGSDKDLYLYMAKAPNGPTVKVQILNVHTMDELKLSGNCLKGSRPIVVFDHRFEETLQGQLMKEVMTQIFAVPASSRRVKPFIDHVISFSMLDGKIWMRNFQKDPSQRSAAAAAATTSTGQPSPADLAAPINVDESSLTEIGPRLVLNPIRIFSGSFGGPVLYLNPKFVPPTLLRRETREALGSRYKNRLTQRAEREERRQTTTQRPAPGPLSRTALYK